MRFARWTPSFFIAVLLTILLLSACRSGAPAAGTSAAPLTETDRRTLFIGGIPDQAPASLARSFDGFAEYLSRQTGLNVKYAPAQDYAAIVSAFERGDVHLVWFGGLTGVQARDKVPGAQAIAQRPRDTEFHSKFIAGTDTNIRSLADLKGKTFTFGSESSTSGHLMPRYFLLEAGLNPDADFQGKPNYSGSHDKTWKLVEAGAYQAGVLNEAVWDKAVQDGLVDQSKVREFAVTPPYFDYNWTIHPDVDQTFGAGSAEKLTQALLNMRAGDGPQAAEILDLFQTDRFIPAQDSDYEKIRQVAVQLGLLK